MILDSWIVVPDEFSLPIKYGYDMELAQSIVFDIAAKSLSTYVGEPISQRKAVVKKYYIQDAQVNPSLVITLTDNWVQLNLWYIVDHKKRRHSKHLLNEAIGEAVRATKRKVNLASVILEIPVVALASRAEK